MLRYNICVPKIDPVYEQRYEQYADDDTQQQSDKRDITSVRVRELYNEINSIWNSTPELVKYNKQIVITIHEYENLYFKIKSKLINKPIKITNAFMKMYTFMLYMRKYLNGKRKISHYDIASAPGMFLIAAERFCHKRGIRYAFHASSWDEGDLDDEYGIFMNNARKYDNVNVCNADDIRRTIDKHDCKYDLVTGDIGVMNDSNYTKLSELILLNEQYGQARLAVDLCKQGGICYLKMFTYNYIETQWLTDMLTLYFDNVMITKPYTSRFMNDESYLICIGRNDVNVGLPFTRPNIGSSYTSPNRDLYESFEVQRLTEKLEVLRVIVEHLSEHGFDRDKFVKSETFHKYFDKVRLLYDVFTLKVDEKELQEDGVDV